MSEDKKIALDYMLSFFDHIKNLNSMYSIYSNTITEIETLFGSDFNRLSQDGKAQVINQRHSVVNAVNNSYLIYVAISNNNPKHIKSAEQQKKDKAISDNVSLINRTFMFKREILYSYIVEMNDYLVKQNLISLFEDKQDLLEAFG